MHTIFNWFQIEGVWEARFSDKYNNGIPRNEVDTVRKMFLRDLEGAKLEGAVGNLPKFTHFMVIFSNAFYFLLTVNESKPKILSWFGQCEFYIKKTCWDSGCLSSPSATATSVAGSLFKIKESHQRFFVFCIVNILSKWLNDCTAVIQRVFTM